MDRIRTDAVVIGGGFYGTVIATHLAKHHGFDVVVVELGHELLARASYGNQARIHNGYHYPRSFTTAYRSHINLPRFVQDWPQAVKKDFTKLYAIARRNSKVSAQQFQRFCGSIGARIEPAAPEFRGLFDATLVERVFLVEEYAFNATVLADYARRDLDDQGIPVLYHTRVTAVRAAEAGRLAVSAESTRGAETALTARYVFNCTYSGLNQVGGDVSPTRTGLKHEIAEMALVRLPSELEGVAVTVMDGPFFSVMPFPPLRLNTLSHVRYTPHVHWTDERGVDPYAKLEAYDRVSRADRMIRDASRYLPLLAEANHEGSLFEVKTVLVNNEGDDGRPILFEGDPNLAGYYSVLGGKIDNVYDVLERLESELGAGA
jgi:glycine/D-amino acid oxidase-like deaminating enzyme